MTRRSSQSGTARGPQSTNRRAGLVVLAGIFGIALIALIVATVSTGGNDGGDAETADVTVSGSALPALPEQGSDPAMGMAAPEVRGQTFDGAQLGITNDGRPKVILFLTHW